jgi:hypothetical protein
VTLRKSSACAGASPSPGAHRPQIGREQSLRRKSGPVAVAQPDAAGPFVVVGHGRAAGGEADLDLRLPPLKIGQPRDQPAGGEGRADADGEHARSRQRGDLRGQVRELIEDRRQPALIGAAGGGEREPVRLALEQRHAQALLEQLHHPADGGGRDVELARGLGEAFGARGRLECPDAVEEGQLAHRPSKKAGPASCDNKRIVGVNVEHQES